MRMFSSAVAAVGFWLGCIVCTTAVHAQCVLPYQIGNGQVADATQVMANYNALIACASPAGSAYALQYNSGNGNFSGVGPLGDGQLVIGSFGAAPRASTLTAGPGIAITNGQGSVTITATGGGAATWTVVTSNTTAVSGGMYLADTSGGSFTITLPNSGVVQIADAKGAFGANNLLVAATSGQTLRGTTYAGASTIALNAPGNNATILCESSEAYVQQVTSGIWGKFTAVNAASLELNNIPPSMDFDFALSQFNSSTNATARMQIGTGTPTTWITSGYGWNQWGTTGQNVSAINLEVAPAQYSGSFRDFVFMFRSNDGLSAINTMSVGTFGWGNWTIGNYQSAGTLATGIKFFMSSGTFSSIVTASWRKLNV